MQVNCFCTIMLSEMTFCTRPFTASKESRSTAFSKKGMPCTTFQRWQMGLLLQWQEKRKIRLNLDLQEELKWKLQKENTGK